MSDGLYLDVLLLLGLFVEELGLGPGVELLEVRVGAVFSGDA
jgi:hypothetical protein